MKQKSLKRERVKMKKFHWLKNHESVNRWEREEEEKEKAAGAAEAERVKIKIRI